MTTLTVNINNEKDLPVIEEILTRFGLEYRVNNNRALNEQEIKLYNRLKKTFAEIKEWEAGKIEFQDAKDAVIVIEAELKNDCKEKLSKRFAGSLELSDEEYNNFQNSVIRGRKEWES